MKPIVTSPRAEAQMLEIELWWLTHRDKNPDLFRDELERALDLIVRMNDAGENWSHEVPGMRRRLLATGHHVYYVNEPEKIRIVAVWGGPRAHGPDLGSEPY